MSEQRPQEGVFGRGGIGLHDSVFHLGTRRRNGLVARPTMPHDLVVVLSPGSTRCSLNPRKRVPHHLESTLGTLKRRSKFPAKIFAWASGSTPSSFSRARCAPDDHAPPPAREERGVGAKHQAARADDRERLPEHFRQGQTRMIFDPTVGAGRIKMNTRRGLGGHQRLAKQPGAEMRNDHGNTRKSHRRRCQRQRIAAAQIENTRQPQSVRALRSTDTRSARKSRRHARWPPRTAPAHAHRRAGSGVTRRTGTRIVGQGTRTHGARDRSRLAPAG